MAKKDKLLRKLLSNPKDFTWQELENILSLLGFEQLATGKTGGSRRKFVNDNKVVLSFHKPHPTTILKEYQIKDVVSTLKNLGIIKDE